jgi:hypothetical protein
MFTKFFEPVFGNLFSFLALTFRGFFGKIKFFFNGSARHTKALFFSVLRHIPLFHSANRPQHGCSWGFRSASLLFILFHVTVAQSLYF